MPRFEILIDQSAFDKISSEEQVTFLRSVIVQISSSLDVPLQSVSGYWNPYPCGFGMPGVEIGIFGSTGEDSIISEGKLDQAAEDLENWLIQNDPLGSKDYAVWTRPVPGGHFHFDFARR